MDNRYGESGDESWNHGRRRSRRAASLLFLGGCEKKQEMPQAGTPKVTTMTVKAQNLPVTMEYVAQTASSRMVNINARVNGFLQKRLYQEGGMVKEGQTLFQIDPRPFQVQLDEAKAALASSKARMRPPNPISTVSSRWCS